MRFVDQRFQVVRRTSLESGAYHNTTS